MADILVVDDDAVLTELVSELLALQGHQVRVAADGRGGLRALDERLPDLVVLDVEMPVLDGPGMAHAMLIQDFGREHVPVVLVSGYVDLPQIAAQVGTPYFTAKPCSVAALNSLIDRALRERRAPRPERS